MLAGLLLPFVGTSLGAACVFFVKREIHPLIEKILMGFASGVMIAASVWSLLIPAMEMNAERMGRFCFLPAVCGICVGILFLLLIDRLVPHLHIGADAPEGIHSRLARTTMLTLAVTIHNLPEGMAVGAVFAGLAAGDSRITMAEAFVLSAGIAAQNFPEGAIISLPLRSGGQSRKKAFLMGTLSGAVEPLGAAATVWMARLLTPMLPFLLSFAAGAMIYVVVEELIPASSGGEQADLGTIGFAAGFLIMMSLDVALG